ncbi:MAG TPA: DUF5690 family protein, partial [Chitinophagaceae bacterium]|nr:DUF5690 family protein [Chitinophagaceae bacterium]
AFGYLGSVLVLFVKDFAGIRLSPAEFFVQAIWFIGTVGLAGTVLAALYFRKRFHQLQTPPVPLYA